jgi:hypothetical protein
MQPSKGKAKALRTTRTNTHKKKKDMLDTLRNPRVSNSCIVLPYGLPEKMTLPLRYSFQVAADADVNTDITLALNGAYDPDVTGTGHQPYLFDQFMALYQRYRVIRSGVIIRYVPVATTNAGAVFMGFIPTLSATSLEALALNSLADYPYMKSVVTNGSGSQYATELSEQVAISSITDTDAIATGLYGSASANPSVIAYGHCVFATLDGTTSLTGRIFIDMLMEVEFSRRVLNTISVQKQAPESTPPPALPAVASTQASTVPSQAPPAYAQRQVPRCRS